MNEIDWSYISKEEVLKEDFIRENKEKLNWKWISKHQVLSEPFIEEMGKYVFWEDMSYWQTLSEEFLENTQKIIPSASLHIYENLFFQCQKMSLSRIKKYKDRYDFWYFLSRNPYLTEDMLETFIEEWDWKRVSAYSRLSEDFMRKYHEKLDWNAISESQTLSIPFIETYKNKINFTFLSRNSHITEETMDHYKEELNWYDVSLYGNVSFSYIKENIERFHLGRVMDRTIGKLNLHLTEEQRKELTILKESIS